MGDTQRWSRLLVIVGLIVSILGVVDPLEGSVVIVAGIAMVTLGAFLGKSPKRKFLSWSLVLVVVGAIRCIREARGASGSSDPLAT